MGKLTVVTEMMAAEVLKATSIEAEGGRSSVTLLIGQNKRTSRGQAELLNGFMSRALDYDDVQNLMPRLFPIKSISS